MPKIHDNHIGHSFPVSETEKPDSRYPGLFHCEIILCGEEHVTGLVEADNEEHCQARIDECFQKLGPYVVECTQLMTKFFNNCFDNNPTRLIVPKNGCVYNFILPDDRTRASMALKDICKMRCDSGICEPDECEDCYLNSTLEELADDTEYLTGD